MATAKISSMWRWVKDLKRGKPGRRFQDHYSRQHDAHGAKRNKAVFIGMGIGLIAVGLVFSVLPVLPGWLALLLGVAAISTQSQRTAKSLDWLEVRARELIRRRK